MKQTMNLGIEDCSTEAYTTGLSWKNLSQTSEGNFIENFYLLCIKTGVCLFMYTHFIYPENCSTLKMFNWNESHWRKTCFPTDNWKWFTFIKSIKILHSYRILKAPTIVPRFLLSMMIDVLPLFRTTFFRVEPFPLVDKKRLLLISCLKISSKKSLSFTKQQLT